MPEHTHAVRSAFTEQAAGFNASPAQNDRAVLDVLIELADPRPTDAWLEAACGPGIVTRELAPRVTTMRGVDLTPAMIELARSEAVRVGVDNTTFEIGDATATPLPDDGLDGAVTRSSLHHVPLPGRLVAEMARVVRPGGRVVVADHLADDDRDAFAWATEIERIRDPSHWACLTRSQLQALGDRAGLALADERVVALALELDEWIGRGTDDADARALVEQLVAARPTGTAMFELGERDGVRTLTLQMWIGAFTAR